MPEQFDSRLALTPTQQLLFEALVQRRSEIAVCYQAAVFILNNPAQPDRMSLAAHALRELMEKLPSDAHVADLGADLNTKVNALRLSWDEVLRKEEPRGGDQWGNGVGEALRTFLADVAEFFRGRDGIPAGRKHQAVQFLNRLDVAPVPLPQDVQRQNAKEWMNLRQFFTDVSHHRFVPDEQAFQGRLNQLEAFLSARLVPRPTDDFAIIDALIAKDARPSKETVTLALEQVAKSAANHQYFFQKLNNPDWLRPLAERGRFKIPPEKQPVGGGVIFPGWPESEYLARMAKLPEGQQQVLQIVLAMTDSDNVRVHADLMDIALTLPAADAAKLVKRARKWLTTPFHKVSMANAKAGDLIAHLAAGGQVKAARQLVTDVFTPISAVPSEHTRDAWAPSPEPAVWLSDWQYLESLKKAVPPLTDADGPRTLALLCALLSQGIALSRRSKDTEGQDYSYIWHAAIERDEYPPRLRNTLVAMTRDTASQIINASPDHMVLVLTELRKHNWPVFRRIEFYLLERFITIALDEIPRYKQELAILEQPTSHEAARLLKTSFSRLPAATQEDILALMDQGPEEAAMRRWFELVGNEPTPEALAHLADVVRAERFALLVGQVPPAWQDRVTEVLGRVGNVRQLDKVERGAVWTGPTSPKTIEELGLLGPDGVIEFLRDWQPAQGERASTPEGLGRNLEQLIAGDPTPYAERATQFQALDPTFVRFLFSGLNRAIKEKHAFPWEPVLVLATLVVGQPRCIPGRKKALMEADESWQWARSAIADLLDEGLQQPGDERVQPEIAFGAREVSWGILARLMADPDPTPEHEGRFGGDNMDPPTLAINSVRGKAFNAVIAYALWVRRHLDQLDPRPPMTFGVMPEVRQVLDAHLDMQKDPSLAIRSCYGQYFPWLLLLDREWVQNAMPKIFLPDEHAAHYRSAAWDAHLQFCSPYDEVLPVLTPEYVRAANAVVKVEPQKKSHHPQQLAEHIMVYYLRGRLTLQSELVSTFFRAAPDDLRGLALDFVGRWLASRPETATVSQDLLARVRDLWQWRLQAARDAADPMASQQELSCFGYWFVSRDLDDEWKLTQLRAVLDLVKLIEPAFKVAEELEALAPRFPFESVHCARLLAQTDRQGWETYASDEHFKAIIKSAIASGNAEANAAADSLVQFFVGRGNFDYRALLS